MVAAVKFFLGVDCNDDSDSESDNEVCISFYFVFLRKELHSKFIHSFHLLCDTFLVGKRPNQKWQLYRKIMSWLNNVIIITV